MLRQRQLQSWCARAPWAVYAAAPLAALASGYFLACLILWSGWKILLPGTDTPFVHVDGFAVYYFGVGRILYYGMPILVGWGIVLLAARQRSGAAWPATGLLLVALIAGTARVHASGPADPGGVGHISMSLDLGSSLGAVTNSLLHAAGCASLHCRRALASVATHPVALGHPMRLSGSRRPRSSRSRSPG